ncbi:MAG: hypothetical protein ABJH72_15280 [Reichenbachiella sp.]|uniref:hypothetical protein n=1 Tax=Reichenbachiella sp. TaxID=2184521 RepID=UPI003298DB92
MSKMTSFRIYYDPLEAEELIEILQKHHIPLERSFEKSENLDNYIGSHPFDTKIMIKINEGDFNKAEDILKEESD